MQHPAAHGTEEPAPHGDEAREAFRAPDSRVRSPPAAAAAAAAAATAACTRRLRLDALPLRAQGVTDYERYQQVFGYGSRRNIVYFTASPEGANVLTSSVLAEVERFDSLVRNDLYMNAYKERKTFEDYGRNYSPTLHQGRALASSPGACFNNQYPLSFRAPTARSTSR